MEKSKKEYQNKSDSLPKEYRVPPNKELESLKDQRKMGITVIIVMFFIFELVVISEENAGRTEEGATFWITLLCFGPVFGIFGVLAWMMEKEKIESLEKTQKQKERTMLGRIKGKQKSAKKHESDGNYDEAIKIWKDLGAYSQVKRVKDDQKNHERKKIGDLEELFHEEKGKDSADPEKHLNEAIEILKNLGDESEIERLNQVKIEYLYEVLDNKIKYLKGKKIDCKALEKELAMLEKSLDKTPE